MSFWIVPPQLQKAPEPKPEPPPQAFYYDYNNISGHTAQGQPYYQPPAPQVIAAPAAVYTQPGTYPATVTGYAPVWYGNTKEQVDAQNAAIAHANAVMQPRQLAPVTHSPSQQFYCRESDGSYTLRTVKDIQENLQPGYWHYAPGGWPYFIRTGK